MCECSLPVESTSESSQEGYLEISPSHPRLSLSCLTSTQGVVDMDMDLDEHPGHAGDYAPAPAPAHMPVDDLDFPNLDLYPDHFFGSGLGVDDIDLTEFDEYNKNYTSSLVLPSFFLSLSPCQPILWPLMNVCIVLLQLYRRG
eukprot:m.411824 g.411824  ORF g.411824 m.411824 type:complete len:143 (-) comp28745_c0_seq1:1023-1451(-)